MTQFASVIPAVRRVLLVGLLACSETTAPRSPTRETDPDATTDDVALAFVDVSVLDMASPAVHKHQTVLVRNGVIEWMGGAGERTAPADARVIQGDGRVLMPALIDMHVHVYEADLRVYVAHGIGTVRNMWGYQAIRMLRDSIATGTKFGPTIFTVSPGLDAPPGVWPVTQFVTTPEEARSVIAAVRAVGYTQLKMYNSVALAMFDTVMKLARENEMPVVGHVPIYVDIRHALAEGMRSIEHLTGYDRDVTRPGAGEIWVEVDETRFASVVQASVAATRTWNCPTLAIYARIHEGRGAIRDHIVINRRRLTKALFDGGAKLLAGSDAGAQVIDGNQPFPAGITLHQELEELVAAGLTPYQALRIATVGAAEYLGRADLGVLAVGKRADLVLLADDPTGRVERARNIGGVVLAGAWTPQREFATRTAGVKAP
jgi:imidazolonepropionase-like amidohydrolase